MLLKSVVLLMWSGLGVATGATPWVTFPATLGTSQIRSAAVDAAGNVYVTGTTYWAPGGTNTFPATAGAFQTRFNDFRPPASCETPRPGKPCLDAFVAKFNPAGQLVYATFLGGSDDEEGIAIAVDQAGNAWVTGYTYSADFPLTANAAQKKNAGPPNISIGVPSTTIPGGDVFVSGLNPSGSALIYSSFFGGAGQEIPNALAIDTRGNLYVAGQTSSTDLPVTVGPAQTGLGFLLKVSSSTPGVVYATYFDVPVSALAVDSSGSPYLTGNAGKGLSNPIFTPPNAIDAFVVKLSADGTTRLYTTLFGGSKYEQGLGVAVDSSGMAWVVGRTMSSDFPATTQANAPNGGAFVARVSADGSRLVSAAVLDGDSTAYSVAVAPSGNVFVSGQAAKPSRFPTTADALEKRTCEPFENFITEWTPDGVLVYSSLSREGPVLTIDRNGDLYLGAGTPVVTRLDLSAAERPSVLRCMTNAASFHSTGVAPGEIVTLFGDRLGPDQPASTELNSGRVGTSIAGIRVLFDGVPAPLLYADSNQINAIAPWSLTPGRNSVVTVEHAGANTAPITVPVVQADPGLFLLQPDVYASQGAILNQDGSVNSSANPAERGSIISLFGTGTGLLDPVPVDGEIITDASHTSRMPVQVMFGGLIAGEVVYAGAAPTLPAGAIQINVRVPQNLPANNAAGILFRVGGGLLSSVLATVALK